VTVAAIEEYFKFYSIKGTIAGEFFYFKFFKGALALTE